MAEITLAYDPKNSLAKKTLKYILSLGIFKPVSKSALQHSLDEVKEGKTNQYLSVDDFFAQLDK